MTLQISSDEYALICLNIFKSAFVVAPEDVILFIVVLGAHSTSLTRDCYLIYARLNENGISQ